MDHPGIDVSKIKAMSDEEYFEELQKIQARLNMAHQMGKHDLISQVRYILETYQAAWNDKKFSEMQEILDKDPKYGLNTINIDWPDPAEEAKKEEELNKKQNYF